MGLRAFCRFVALMQFNQNVVEAAGSDFSLIEEYMDNILQKVDEVHRYAGLRLSGVVLTARLAFAGEEPLLL